MWLSNAGARWTRATAYPNLIGRRFPQSSPTRIKAGDCGLRIKLFSYQFSLPTIVIHQSPHSLHPTVWRRLRRDGSRAKEASHTKINTHSSVILFCYFTLRRPILDPWGFPGTRRHTHIDSGINKWLEYVNGEGADRMWREIQRKRLAPRCGDERKSK